MKLCELLLSVPLSQCFICPLHCTFYYFFIHTYSVVYNWFTLPFRAYECCLWSTGFEHCRQHWKGICHQLGLNMKHHQPSLKCVWIENKMYMPSILKHSWFSTPMHIFNLSNFASTGLFCKRRHKFPTGFQMKHFQSCSQNSAENKGLMFYQSNSTFHITAEYRQHWNTYHFIPTIQYFLFHITS